MSKPLKILFVSNRYLIAGGERQVFEAELKLLRDNGHIVQTYVEDNRRIASLGKVRTAAKTIWSHETYRTVRSQLKQEQFDLVHVHNAFPLISPSVYYAAQAEQTPLVQTLHNFRLLCINGLLYRNGAVCEDCVGRSVPLPGIYHACYKGSRAGSITAATMLSFHRAIKTWDRLIDTYIALTEFSRQKFIDGGLSGSKITIKPNFLAKDPGCGDGRGRYALYVGLLSTEKGVDTLLTAWQKAAGKVPLKIIGEGPLQEKVAAAANATEGIEYLGRVPNEQVLEIMRDALFLVFPSALYENFPMAIVEAFATGLPVLTSDQGNASALIQPEETGLHFRSGDANGLAHKAMWLVDNPKLLNKMRGQARAAFEAQMSPRKNYQLLAQIYDKTLASRKLPKEEGYRNLLSPKID